MERSGGKPGRDQTLLRWLTCHETHRPAAPALSTGEATISYGELARNVRRLCSALAALGVQRGDVVAAQLGNTVEFVTAYLAATARGAIFQTLHAPYRSNELRMQLADSGACAVFAVSADDATDRIADLASVRADLPKLRSIIAVGPRRDRTVAFAELLATEARAQDIVESTTDDLYLLLYTSGTVAVPKGVPHRYRGFLNNALEGAREMEIGEGDRVLSVAPFSHLYGLFVLNLALSSGATASLLPAYRPPAFLDDLARLHPTHVYAAPAHFAPLVSSDALQAQSLAGIRLICLSGSAVPVALAEAVEARMSGGCVIQLWGMSELQAGAYGRPADPAPKRLSTTGRASPGTELRVVPDQGEPGPGREGRLQVKAASLFSGYLNRPDENRRAFTADGWFETGDLARIDGEGFLTITGRTKEIINRGGVKYNPTEVEEVLLSIPAIVQCAVVAIPDPELGERGCLCAQLKDGTTLSLDDVTARLAAAGFAKYKWPERLVLLPDLPQTPTRKIKRGDLQKIVLSMNHQADGA